MSDPRSLRGGPLHPSLSTLGAACSAAGGRLLAGDPALPVGGAAADTRAVVPGDLFCAFRGARVDAHTMLPDAFAAGAAAALVDRPPGGAWSLCAVPPGRGVILAPGVAAALGRLASAHLAALRPGPCVVGVTGSVGKTTARALIGAAVSAGDGAVLVAEESFNTEISLPLVCLRAAARHRCAVLELAMRGPGEIAHLAAVCRPRIGVLTAIGESHMELLGSIEAIAAAKGELLAALPADGFAVLNADDPRQRPLAALSRAPVLTYGLHPDAAVRGEDVRPLPGGQGFTFTARLASGRRVPVRLPLLGRHQVQAALAALCCAELLGVDPSAAAAALEGARPLPGRLALQRCGRLLILDDTFNAAPQSGLAALDALAGLTPGGGRAAVLGDMLELGPAAPAAHRTVGRAAAGAGLDWLLTVGPLARGIAAAAREAGLPGAAVHEAADAGEAEPILRSLMAGSPAGSVILFKASHAARMERLMEAAAAWPEARDGAAGEAAGAGAEAGG